MKKRHHFIACLLFFFLSSNHVNGQTNNKQTFALLNSYAQIAAHNYQDVLTDAKALEKSIKKLAENPSTQTLEAAKIAWLIARESYGQSEIFRLSQGPIDAETGWVNSQYGALENGINAWPIDENLIDYTIDHEGNKTQGNIVDTLGFFKPSGTDASAVDVTILSAETLKKLNENGNDANVTTGYHAIEFLLWGQDQDYNNFILDTISHGAKLAGQRPLSDFTSDRYSKRRLAYLIAASEKLSDDLAIITAAWQNNKTNNYRAALLGKHNIAKRNLEAKNALKQILLGMANFIKAELSNERIAVALLTPSEEDEHSCFSDNSHRDITMNYQGFKNIIMATYNGIDYGSALFDAMPFAQQKKLLTLMHSIEKNLNEMNVTAQQFRHFDYQIRPNDPSQKNLTQLKNKLRKLADMVVIIASANGIDLFT